MTKKYIVDRYKNGFLIADENFQSFFYLENPNFDYLTRREFKHIYREDITFFNYRPLSNYKNISVFLIGIPYSMGTNKKDSNVHLFPNILRKATSMYPVYNRLDKQASSGLYDINTGEKLFEGLVFEDLGNTLENDLEFKGLKEGVSFSLKESAVPLLIGGDHSITFYSLQTILENTDVPILVIDFDAHHDCGTSFILEKEIHHGNFIRHLIKDERIIGVIQLGGRGIRSVSQVYRNEKIVQIPSNGVNPTNLLDSVNKFIKNRCNACIYLTFDLDCLDWSNFQIIDFPVHNGPNWNILLETLSVVFKIPRKIIGVDLVEGSYEEIVRNKISEYSAAVHILAYILDGLHKQRREFFNE
ncbi:arginase family protein [Parageobacillus thermoglucosidasius]|uniref:Arginase family protein n=1 Tax=Parageobacillus thermoglucosidasius TaxID=1426 RepID=A0AB38R0W4_PARTM|nr:arginase family protein [Parageobacillus thermoglucosidasius]UOE77542.1 arginase family protein [Parageobacillus thermoglucosidasius]